MGWCFATGDVKLISGIFCQVQCHPQRLRYYSEKKIRGILIGSLQAVVGSGGVSELDTLTTDVFVGPPMCVTPRLPAGCRFGIGRFTTEEEIDYTADKCISEVRRLREMR